MHIALVSYILPQDMAFQSRVHVVPYSLFTAKFNGEGDTVQHHLTISTYSASSSSTVSGDLQHFSTAQNNLVIIMVYF